MLSLRKLLGRNLGVKLLSLVLAVALWYTAVGRERAEVGLNVPLEMINFPADMVVANQPPDGISMRIRGPVALTRQMADRNLRFSLDMSTAAPGSNQFTLEPEALNLPRGLEVTYLAPTQVTVYLEKVVSKNISLLPVIKGEPVTGFIIDDIILDPKQIEVRGPTSAIEPVDILWTEPVDVTKLFESITLVTAPNLPDPALKLVKPTQIKVNLKISEKIVTRVFENVTVQPMQPGTDVLDFSLNPDKVSLTLRAPYNVLSKLPADGGISVRVPLAGLAPGKHERLPIITVPEKVELVKVEPRVVQIVIYGEIIGTEQ